LDDGFGSPGSKPWGRRAFGGVLDGVVLLVTAAVAVAATVDGRRVRLDVHWWVT
jgi:hypothetical protein